MAIIYDSTSAEQKTGYSGSGTIYGDQNHSHEERSQLCNLSVMQEKML